MKKRYDGYTAYGYLTARADYRVFDLPDGVDRVPSQQVDVTREQEARVDRLLDEHVVISLHDHPTFIPNDVSQIFDYRREGRDVTAYAELSRSRMDVVFDNLNDGSTLITSKNGWKWEDVLFDLGMRQADLAHQDYIVPVLRYDDILRCKRGGLLGMVFSLEAATMIENELDRLDILYGFGVRSMGLVYSESNSLGSGLKEARDGGLTVLGRQVVRRMNQLGIAIDVSHAGDQTSLDIAEASELPVFITHAGARKLWSSARMKPDDVIRAVAERGGMMGIEAAPHTTLTTTHPRHSIDSVMEHFEYVAELVGMDHVGFGPDTLYGDHVGLHEAFSTQLGVAAIHRGLEFPKVEFVDGMENPTETFPNIVRWLVKHGYSDEDIGKVIGGNAQRILRQIWR